MSTPPADLVSIRQGLEALLEPLRGQLTELDAAIAQQTAALEELKRTRSAVSKTVTMLDPHSTPKKPGPKPVTRNGGRMVGEENLQRFHAALLEHMDEINVDGGTNRNRIFEITGLPHANKTSFMYAMRIFHEQGLITLDHQTKARGGPLSFFKVVG